MVRRSVNTLIDALEEGADIELRGLSFLNYRMQKEDLSWSVVARESARRCGYLRSMGLNKGERIGLIVPDEKEFVLWFFGSVMAGCIPVPAYPPLPTGRSDSYVERTAHIFRACGASRLITSTKLFSVMKNLKAKVPSLLGDLIIDEVVSNSGETFAGFDDPMRMDPSDVCFVQFTSGSTGSPKGVIITHENLLANVRSMVELTRPDAEVDVYVNWLPLYHDMGLIGCVILTAILHSKAILMSPYTFVTRPQSWLETVDKYRGTYTGSPNFGLGLATKYCDYIEGLDLSCLRAITCGAEPINPNTIRRFLDAYEPAGLKRNVIVPAYGMAEATLCVTMNKIGERFTTISIDRKAYETKSEVVPISIKEANKSIEIVSCGRPIPGHSIGIVDPDEEFLPDGRVGLVLFKGPSVTKGYFDNSVASEELFYNGWLKTGDLGFVLDGDLYISGRSKDLIIIDGRNYYPQEIESVVEMVSGIRTGNAAAFSIFGSDTERLVVVAEWNGNGKIDEVKSEISKTIFGRFGIRPCDIVLIISHSLPKTSSGKLQRCITKQAYETDRLERVEGAP